MNGLAYVYTEGEINEETRKPVKVRFEGRITGEIRSVEGGWRYVPKGQREENGGSILPTVSRVQASIEGRSDE